jgi:FkbM family methyltransferase
MSRLRPAKVRSALRRRWFERRMRRTPLDPVPGLVELGSPYGGWIVPGEEISPAWTCYCVGAGGDVSFDLELIRRYGVTVRSFDAVEDYVRRAAADADGAPGFSAHHAAIATADGPLRVQVTHHVGSRSVSAAGLYDSRDHVEVPGRTLPSLMAELGDARVDLLKLDVEGSEYEVLPTLDLESLGVRVLAVQLHHTGTLGEARRLLDGLRERGYRPVACRPVVKLTWLRESAST